MKFENKVVLVTGAGRGMGRAVALEYARQGANVVVSARTAEYGEETVKQIRALKAERAWVRGDIADRDAVRAMIDAAINASGRLDILVHCAAGTAHGLRSGVPARPFDRLIR